MTWALAGLIWPPARADLAPGAGRARRAETRAGVEAARPVRAAFCAPPRLGFNHSGWLAAGWLRSSDVRPSVDALKRAQATPNQGGLLAGVHRRNVQVAFRVQSSRKGLVQGVRVRVDDHVRTARQQPTAAGEPRNGQGLHASMCSPQRELRALGRRPYSFWNNSRYAR